MGEFEKDIRDMFVDLEVAIDTNELWNGIEKKLDKKDKKRPVWWFILPIILLSIIAFTIYTQSNKNIDSKTSKSATSTINTKEIAKENSAITTPIQEEANTQAHNRDTKTELITDRSKKNKSKPIVSNTRLLAKLGHNPENHTDNAGAIIRYKTSDSVQKEIINQKTNTRNSISLSGIKKERLRYTIIGLSKNIDALINENIYELSLNDFNPKTNIRETTGPKNAWEKSLDIGIGFALVKKSLDATDKDFTYYRDKRESTESYLEAINGNLSFSIKNKSGFFISTGINYTQIDERFTSKDSTDLLTNKLGISKEITEADGSKTVIRSQKDVVNFIKWDKIIYNYYHFIDIPLSIGYSMDINNWQLELSSGLSYNVAFAKRGQIIGIEDYPVDMNDADLFKSNSGLSLISDLKIIFDIKNHTFYLEPNIKYQLSSITTKGNPIEQKYFIYGIKLGSRIRF